jgi:hypothetical protein
MKKIILTFILFTLSLSAHAQIYENYLFEDVNLFIAKCSINKNIRDKDAEVLKQNNVKQVIIKNEDGKIVSKLLINRFGYIEEYNSFSGIDETLEAQWRFGYDDKNNLTAVSRREGRYRVNHIFSYENNLLASVQSDSNGVQFQADVAHYEDGRIMRVTSFQLDGTYELIKQNYNYDSDNRLKIVSDENNEKIFYEISYKKNSVSINLPSIMKDTYKFKDDRITEEIYTFYTEKNIKAEQYYGYDEKGLVSAVKIRTSKTKPTVESYEYVFN